MSFYTCLNCKKEIPTEDRIKHELYCSAVKNNEYENLIPCEYCNEFVNFENYSQHISSCYASNSFNLINFIENINSSNNSGASVNETENEHENEDENVIYEAHPPVFNIELNGLPSQLGEAFSNLVSQMNGEIQGDDNYEYLTELGNSMGNVDNGIDDIDKISKKIESLELLKCPICMKKKNDFRKTKCKHLFCESCLSTWLEKNKKCPICMINLDEIKK